MVGVQLDEERSSNCTHPRHEAGPPSDRSAPHVRGSGCQRCPVVKTFYKGEKLGSLPACAICGGAGQGRRAEVHLPGGVSIWLCAAHRSPEFLTRRAGRDLATSLLHVWRAAGCLTASRSRAIDLHLARIAAEAPSRERPGSYSWSTLRREAEERFAAGEPPSAVITRLRSREEGAGLARPPSVATMRRWFREGRWLAGSPASRPPLPQPGEGAPGSVVVTNPSDTYHSTVRRSDSSMGV